MDLYWEGSGDERRLEGLHLPAELGSVVKACHSDADFFLYRSLEVGGTGRGGRVPWVNTGGEGSLRSQKVRGALKLLESFMLALSSRMWFRLST